MDGRLLCCGDSDISLYFATRQDQKLVFDMMGMEDKEVFDSMFYGESRPQTWDEYEDDESEFYTGAKGKNNYLLIAHAGEIIGSVSHSYNAAKIENMELDIWLRSKKFLGKGLGSQTLVLLTDYLHREYSIETFIMRPGAKNRRAIRAYEKCGFAILDNFDPRDYYDSEAAEKWGAGDYGVEETVNMAKRRPRRV
ncbi:MAG: GNAT family N-acetyltransferase [Spirochaetes bacterium]|nr:GNAT family N-acetyltransferase [Spirochaetota bacterium]